MPQSGVASPTNTTITFPPVVTCISNASHTCGTPGIIFSVGSVNITQLPPPNIITGGAVTIFGNDTTIASTTRTTKTTNSQSTTSTTLTPLPLDAKGHRFPQPFTVTKSVAWAGIGAGPPNSNVLLPDVAMAAGPSQILEMVNYVGEVFTKAGQPIVNQQTHLAVFSLQSFYGTTDSLGDPTVIFDTLSGRWFTAATDENPARVWFAVSNSGDAANGGWHIYNFSGSGDNICLVDQPRIGVNLDKFVISGNNFKTNFGICGCHTCYLGDQYWAVDKRQLIENIYTGAHFNTWGPNANQISVFPTTSLSSTNIEYLIQAGNTPPSGGNNNVATLYSITGVPPYAAMSNQPPQFTMLGFDAFQCPRQPGGSTVVCTPADSRVQTAVWFKNNLWFALADSSFGIDNIRIAEINTATNQLTQNFDWTQTNARNHQDYLFYPALTVDAMGSMVVIYGYSNADDYPSLAVSEQAVTDPYNILQPPLRLLIGTQIANDSNRYGDYFSAVVDPSSPTNVWVAGEIMQASQCGGVNCWGTYIAEIPQTSYFTSTVLSPLSIQLGLAGGTIVSSSSYDGYADTISLGSQVTISLTATLVEGNVNCRTFGLVWDQILNLDFWNSQPSSVIGQCQSPFNYPPTLQVLAPPGSHYLEFGVSAWTGEWHVQISLNGLQVADIDTDVYHHVHIVFNVGGIMLISGPAGYTSPPICTENPPTTTLTPGGVVAQYPNCSTSATTTMGTYNFAVTTAGGWISVQNTLAVNVIARTLSNNPLGSDWVQICGCGVWGQSGGYIDGQNAWAELSSQASFASGRTVQVRMISLNEGSQVYNAAWFRPKFIDDNNEVIIILHTDGTLELSVIYQGIERTLATPTTCLPTCLSPLAWHTFKTNISGNTVNVWVDGTQYITNLIDTTGDISALGACNIALMNGGNTHSEWDSATVSN